MNKKATIQLKAILSFIKKKYIKYTFRQFHKNITTFSRGYAFYFQAIIEINMQMSKTPQYKLISYTFYN